MLLDLIFEDRIVRVCCPLEWLLDQGIYPIGCVDFMLGTCKFVSKIISLFDFESGQVSDIGKLPCPTRLLLTQRC